MATFYKAATSNAFSTTLNGSIGSSDTTVALNSVSGLQAPGVLVIDRQDGSGNNTPTVREYITYTGISSNNLTGVGRASAGSTGQAHSSGALVEETMSIDHWNDARTLFLTEHDTAGKHVISTATITSSIYASGASATISDVYIPHTLTLSGASVQGFVPATLTITTALNISGASFVGTIPRALVWRLSGAFAGATTFLMPPIMTPTGGNWQWFSFVTRTVASGVSAIIDINKNGTSIFDTIGRPMIAAGGTFVSTPSIATKAIAAGDKFTIDYDGTGGSITDILIEGFYTP